jgi:hypothetical protein
MFPQPTFFSERLPEGLIRSSVHIVILQDHSAAEKLRQAVTDNLNSQAASYADVPKSIQNILSHPEVYQGQRSTKQFYDLLCYYVTSATDEFETCIEETTIKFEIRLRKEIDIWLATHEKSSLLPALEEKYDDFPFLKDFIHHPTAMGGARGYVLTETYACISIAKILKQVLNKEILAPTETTSNHTFTP